MKAKLIVVIMVIAILSNASYGAEKLQTREDYEKIIEQQQAEIETLEKTVSELKKQALDLRWEIHQLKYGTDSNEAEQPTDGEEENKKQQTIIKSQNKEIQQLTAYPVARVVDGDTIVINDGEEITVRLIGVDTPETVHPSKPVEYYGKEASNFTQNLLKGEKVYLVIDPQQGKTDRYGRTLAYVYRSPDGLFVNAEIIRQGYGHAYTGFPFKHMEDFQQLERDAKKTGKGLWGQMPEERASTAIEKAVPPVVAPVIKSQKKISSSDDDVTVYVTQTGKKYHRGSCSYLKKSKRPMKLQDAKAAGYTPCSKCGPPE